MDLSLLRPVFSALLEGNLAERFGEFSPAQLAPFFPYLLTAFTASANTARYAEKMGPLLGRLTTLEDANRVLEFASVDFASLPERPICIPAECAEDKLRIIYKHIEQEKSHESFSFVSPTATEEASDLDIILPLLVTHFPSLIEENKLVLNLLNGEGGTKMLINVLLNVPSLLDSVIAAVLEIQQNEDSLRGRNRAQTLKNIIALCPHKALPILRQLGETRRDAPLAVRIACDVLDDSSLLQFVVPHLSSKTTPVAQQLKRANPTPTMQALSARVYGIVEDRMTSNSKEPLTDVLFLATTLQLTPGMKYSSKENGLLTELCTRVLVDADDAHRALALATLVSVPVITFHPTNMLNAPADPRVVEFLKHCRQITAPKDLDENEMETDDRSVMPPNHTPFAHTLLYIHACLAATKTELLTDYLGQILKCKVTIVPRHVNTLRILLQTHCLSDTELGKRCALQPITRQISESSGSGLPANIIEDLLRCNFFNHHPVNIGRWLELQLGSLALPINKTITDLVERYAFEAATRPGVGLSSSFVESVFDDDIMNESKMPLRLCVMLYLVAYRANWEKWRNVIQIYTNEVYSRIPIRYLLSAVETRPKDFKYLRGALTRLCTDIFPFMLPTTESVLLAAEIRYSDKAAVSERQIERLKAVIEGANATKRRKALQSIELLSIADQVRLLDVIVNAYRRTLEPGIDQSTITVVQRLWLRLEHVVPRMLCERSIVAWLDPLARTEVRLEDVYDKPPLIFRCDRRIFSSPPHFECFTRLSTFFFSACRTHTFRELQRCLEMKLGNSDVERNDREVLIMAMQHTMESLLVQLLVEVSDPRRMDKGDTSETRMAVRREIAKLAGQYIHQIFLNDRQVMKIAIFQTFPLHQLAHLVEDVPSLYFANEFIAEMLNIDDVKRRVFAIALLVEISKKYRIPATAQQSEYVMDVVDTLSQLANFDDNIRLFEAAAPYLAELATVFPQFAGDIALILVRISSMAKSSLAYKNALTIAPGNSESKVLEVVTKNLTSQIDLELPST